MKQMKPSFLPELQRNKERSLEKDSNPESKGCREGMVPIMRSKISNHTHLSYLSKMHLGSISPFSAKYPGSHVS